MNGLSRRRSGLFRSCEWALALAAVLCLAGCKGFGSREDGLRDSDLTDTARQARVFKNKKEEAKKAADDPWMSERANQISRNLQ